MAMMAIRRFRKKTGRSCACEGVRMLSKSRASDLRRKVTDQHGQMMVELCVIFPVVLIIAFIAVNALTFFGECARFDRVAHNSVRIASSSPSFSLNNLDRIGEDVLIQLEDGMAEDNLDIRMDISVTAENYMRYEMEFVYHPTLFGLSMRSEVFGVSLPSLSHRVGYTVDPYRAGAFL